MPAEIEEAHVKALSILHLRCRGEHDWVVLPNK